MLNISRPSLIQLLDEGKIEYRKLGTHRRVRFEALIVLMRNVVPPWTNCRPMTRNVGSERGSIHSLL
jgi:excisionase family DNA binding protein